MNLARISLFNNAGTCCGTSGLYRCTRRQMELNSLETETVSESFNEDREGSVERTRRTKETSAA